jgi:biopolymer transport protein ExbD
MECPKCKLISPPNVNQCDCGYNFITEDQSNNSQISFLTQGQNMARTRSKKVGGWLLFFCLTLTIFYPLFAFWGIILPSIRILESLQNDPELYIPILADAISVVALAVLSVCSGIRLWCIRPFSIAAAKTCLICILAYHVILVISAYMGEKESYAAFHTQSVFFLAINGFAYPLIWYVYLLISKRVKETYSIAQPVFRQAALPILQWEKISVLSLAIITVALITGSGAVHVIGMERFGKTITGMVGELEPPPSLFNTMSQGTPKSGIVSTAKDLSFVKNSSIVLFFDQNFELTLGKDRVPISMLKYKLKDLKSFPEEYDMIIDTVVIKAPPQIYNRDVYYADIVHLASTVQSVNLKTIILTEKGEYSPYVRLVGYEYPQRIQYLRLILPRVHEQVGINSALDERSTIIINRDGILFLGREKMANWNQIMTRIQNANPPINTISLLADSICKWNISFPVFEAAKKSGIEVIEILVENN